MQIKFFCPRWGSANIPWESFCKKAKDAGFDGVETPIPFGNAEQLEIMSALKKHELLLIGQYYQSFEKDLDHNKENFKKHMESMAALKPLLIDAQTGKDYFNSAQNRELFQLAIQITNETGVLIAHETHRLVVVRQFHRQSPCRHRRQMHSPAENRPPFCRLNF